MTELEKMLLVSSNIIGALQARAKGEAKMARTLDSIAALGPLWRADWHDKDNMLVETRLLDDIGRMRLLQQFDMIKCAGETAVSLEIVPLTEEARDADEIR